MAELTADRARALLSYDEQSGRLFRRVSSGGTRAGSEAGFITRKMGRPYRVVKVDNVGYFAHRLIWLIKTGEWPKNEIDHRDRDSLNNAWANLREATHTENMANTATKSKLGIKGVRSRRGGYYAYHMFGGRQVHLGVFSTKEEASAAYRRAARDLRGEFACAVGQKVTEGKT